MFYFGLNFCTFLIYILLLNNPDGVVRGEINHCHSTPDSSNGISAITIATIKNGRDTYISVNSTLDARDGFENYILYKAGNGKAAICEGEFPGDLEELLDNIFKDSEGNVRVINPNEEDRNDPGTRVFLRNLPSG